MVIKKDIYRSKNNKIFVYINFRKRVLKIEFYKIQSYKIKSGRKGFILDDPKNIFKVIKSCITNYILMI